jgi:hypothetical protein
MEPGENKEVIVDNNATESLVWCRALIDNTTFNVETNSVDVIAATDTPCLAIDPSDGSLFNQILSFDPSHVRMARIQAGGPVLDNHNSKGSIRDIQLGVVENARIEGGKLLASLRFSKRPDLVPFVNDVKDGIIKGISTRFRVYLYRDITLPTDTHRTLLAIDWEPIEISATPIPEDFKSTIRLMGDIEDVVTVENTEEIIVASETERSLIDKSKTIIIKMEETEAEKAIRLDAEKAGRTIVVNEERVRSLAIIEAANSVGLEPEFATEHVKLGTTLDTFRSLVINKVAEKQKETDLNPHNVAAIKVGADKTKEGRVLALEEAITIRSFGVETLGKDGPKTEYGKRVANGGRAPRLSDFGVFSLETSGVDASRFDEGEIFARSMATGDFPITLANVMNKNLRQRYQQAEPQWKKFAKKVTAKDFKKIFSVQVDGNQLPGKLTEKGEYPNVSFKEAGDSFALDTYGLTFSMSRQLFINDDLGAFEKFAPLVSDGFIYNQTQLVYNALLGAGGSGLGRVIGEDNKTLFHAAHNNLVAVGAGGPPSIAAFTAAQIAMRRQKTLSGRIMNANKPKFLVVPPELEVAAKTILHGIIVANQVSNVNTFTGQYDILVEDFFTNTTAWLLVADPGRVESVKYATLDGQEGIFTEQWWEPGKDCWKMKSRNDFSATAEEFRGVYQNAGI